MSKRMIVLLSMALWADLTVVADPATELGIVPRPKSVELGQGDGFSVKAGATLYCNDAAAPSTEYLAGILGRVTGIDFPVSKAGDRGAGISLVVDPGLNVESEQGYSLVSTDKGVRISGKSPVAVFYGVQTFLQLLPPEVYSPKTALADNSSWKIPSVQIVDEPYFERIRGLHIDVSRHFLTKEEVFRIIDYVVMHKMNVLHMHLTDNPGWRMEIKAYPKLTEIGAAGNHSSKDAPARFFTQEDLREIIAYANSRYIQVLPEIDMPGHMRAAIRAYPELKHPRSPKVIRIDEEGEKFCRQVLEEVVDVFGGDVPLHIGFDEVNLGAKTPIYTDEEITEFARKMTAFLKDELKVTPVVWDDAFEKGLHDKDTLVHWWRPGKKAWWEDLELTMDQKVQKFDQPYILSPGSWTYFDMKYARDEPGAGWGGAISVNKVYNWEPMLDLVDADPAKRLLAQGITACTWSERIPTFDVWQQRVFPRLAPLAEKCWAQPLDEDASKPDWDVWRDKVLIGKQLKRYDHMGVNYWGKDNPEKLRTLSGNRGR